MTSRWLPLLMVLAAGLPGAAWAQAQKAEVLSIGDGDTIRVRQGGHTLTVRLACIDAPETAQSPWGQQARRFLQQRLPIGQPVTLQVKTIDRYNRTVAEVISEININLAMVEDGQAFAYRRYLGDCDAKDYLDAEARASRRRMGVWQVPGGILRPWDFRRQRRGGTALDQPTRLVAVHRLLSGRAISIWTGMVKPSGERWGIGGPVNSFSGADQHNRADLGVLQRRDHIWTLPASPWTASCGC